MDAPKKIWVEHEYREWSFKPSDFEDGTETTPYIRADLVDGLVKALEMCVKHLDADGNLWSKEEQTMALAALKALEENND